MNGKKYRTIWDSQPDFKDWEADLRDEYPDLSEEKLVDIMYDTNKVYLDDERANLNVGIGLEIIVIADLGLWNGRHAGYKRIESGNIADCLYSNVKGSSSECHWYLDEEGDLWCREAHHDGVNLYLYRAFRKGISDSQKDKFCDEVCHGNIKNTEKYTRRLGDFIANVYGFKLKGGIHI